MGAFRARFVLPPLLVPVPLRATVRVGLVALLDTVTFPEAAPAAVGVNVTLTVQDAPAAIEAPQVLVDANGPVAETEDTLAAAPPVLVTVTVWAAEVEPTAWLPKDREVGDAASVALPPELVPVPDRLTELVTPPALTVRGPGRLPGAGGAGPGGGVGTPRLRWPSGCRYGCRSRSA